MDILKIQFDPLFEMDIFNRSCHFNVATTWLRSLLSISLNEGQQLSKRRSAAHVEGVGSADVPVLFAVWFDTTRQAFPFPII